MTVEGFDATQGQNAIQRAEKVVSISVIVPDLDDASAMALKTRISEAIKDVPGSQIHFAIHERTAPTTK